MNGYIGVTDNNWAEFLKGSKITRVNFWRKKKESDKSMADIKYLGQ